MQRQLIALGQSIQSYRFGEAIGDENTSVGHGGLRLRRLVKHRIVDKT